MRASRFHDWDVIRRVMARGDIGLGEEYIAGSWETDNVEALISLFLLNLDHLEEFSDGNFINRLGFVIHNALVRRNSDRRIGAQHQGALRCRQRLLLAVAGQEHDLFVGALSGHRRAL